MNQTKLFVAMLATVVISTVVLFALPALSNAKSDFLNGMGAVVAIVMVIGTALAVNQYILNNKTEPKK